MRILYLSCVHATLAPHLSVAFTENGHEFISIDKFTDGYVRGVCDVYKPDVVIVHRNKPLVSKEVLSTLSDSLIILWMNDERVRPKSFMLSLIDCVDLYLVASDESVSIFKEMGSNAEYLMMGCIKAAVTDIDRTVNLAFLGNNHGEDSFPLSTYRNEIIGKLQVDLKDEFVLKGNGWNGTQAITHRFYRHVKIGLSINHINHSRCYSNRILEIMNHGAMCLSNRGNGLDTIFKEDKTIVYFDDYEDMLDKYRYYIQNDSKREAIAKKGQEFVHKNLTWEHKGAELLKIINKYR